MKSLRYRSSILACVLLIVLTGCGMQAPAPTATPQRTIGLALGRGGLGDRSFNDSTNEGLQQAQSELGIRYRVMELTGDNDQVTNLKLLLTEQYDLIIVVGQEYVAALQEVAAANPTQRFAILDAVVDAPNVTSITFREMEGDFLAGALSAMLSENGLVGFLGGADIPLIRRIEHGWSEGVRYINPQATILSEYAGDVGDFSGFTKPELGHELTMRMYDQQAEVIYAAAGRTTLGAIDAAQERQRPIITTGSDQRWIAPAVVVTSRTKNMNTAVLILLRDLVAGTLAPGTRELDLKSGGIGMAGLDSPLITSAMRERLAAIENELKNGTLVIKGFTTP